MKAMPTASMDTLIRMNTDMRMITVMVTNTATATITIVKVTTSTMDSHGNDAGHHHRHEHDDHAAHDHDDSHSRGGDSPAEPLLKPRSAKLSQGPSKRNPQSNINVEGAYLHVLVGVMIGGAVIWYHPSWKFVDPICTLFFSVLVLGTTLSMIRDIVEVLMEILRGRSMQKLWRVVFWRFLE